MKDSGRSKRQKLKKQITLLKTDRDSLNVKIDKLETKLMTKCPHPFEALREGGYESHGAWSTAPMRVCTDCGRGEEGWGSGYWKLDVNWERHSEIPKLSRDQAFKFVRKFWTQDAMAEVRYKRVPPLF